jgi:hypothetical protein
MFSLDPVLRPTQRLRDFELAELRRGVGGPEEAFRIAEALLAEARELGVIPGPDPLSGIEVDVRLRKALRALGTRREEP